MGSASSQLLLGIITQARSPVALRRSFPPWQPRQAIEGPRRKSDTLRETSSRVDQILEYSKFSGEMNSRPVALDREAFRLSDVFSDLIDMCAATFATRFRSACGQQEA